MLKEPVAVPQRAHVLPHLCESWPVWHLKRKKNGTYSTKYLLMSFLLWPESHSLTFPLRKCKEFQPSTEGVDRRARRSHRYRGGGHKTLLAVSVLAPGASVLPIKLWGSYGCNEVVGTKVAITAQLNCHQHLMEAQDQTLTESKYLQIPSEAQILSRHAAAF